MIGGVTCDSGWTLSASTGRCYKMMTSRISWAEARAHCQGLGTNGDLASIPDQETNEIIYLQSKEGTGSGEQMLPLRGRGSGVTEHPGATPTGVEASRTMTWVDSTIFTSVGPARARSTASGLTRRERLMI